MNDGMKTTGQKLAAARAAAKVAELVLARAGLAAPLAPNAKWSDGSGAVSASADVLAR
jgi:hypothetical protein